MIRSTYSLISIVLLLLVLSGCAKCRSDKYIAREKIAALGVEYSESAFINSIIKREYDTVDLFLASGMNPDARFNGETVVIGDSVIAQDDVALIIAVALDDLAVVSRLLEYRARVDEADSLGRTALMQAKGAVAESLLDCGADINKTDRHGFTALMYAAIRDDAETVRLLLDRGASTKAKNEFGVTPLMNAAGSGYNNAVRALLAGGADVNARDRYGYTALRFAKEDNQVETIKMLLEAGARNLSIIKRRPTASELFRSAIIP